MELILAPSDTRRLRRGPSKAPKSGFDRKRQNRKSFEKIEIRDIVVLSRWIKARLMRRDGGRDKPCARGWRHVRDKDPKTGSGLKRTPMPGGLAIRVLPAPGSHPGANRAHGRAQADCGRMGSAGNGAKSVGNDATRDSKVAPAHWFQVREWLESEKRT